MRNATFCDVLHEIKQKLLQTLESAQNGLEIFFKCFELPGVKDSTSLRIIP